MNASTEPATALDLQVIFRALPGLYLVLSPDFIILEASEAYLQSTLKDRSIIGKYLFDAFPDNPDLPQANGVLNLKQSLEYARDNRVPHKMAPQRYDVTKATAQETEFEEKYWQPLNSPVLDSAGEVLYLIHQVEDITQLQKQRQEQEIATGNLQSFVEASGGVSWDYDIKSQKFYWGKSFEKIFGYSVSDAGESPSLWDERVHPEEYKKLRDSLNKAVNQQEKVWTGKYRFQKADGTYTQVMDHGYILYDDEGKPYRMLGTLVDIDRQQKHERLAKENLERFQLLAKATNDVIWDWNLKDDSIWWNEGFKVTFGYKQEDIEHDINSWYGRIHPDDAERVVLSIHHVIDNGGINWQDDYRFRKADGTYADIFDRGIIARDNNGSPIRMIGAMVDITEKNRYAAEIRASEQHVKALLEGIPEIAWVAHADGYIYYYNKAWYAYTGNTGPDDGWDGIVHPEDLAFTIERWSRALATGKEYVNEARLKRASDGQYRWFTMRATPLHDEQGNIQAWIGVDTDIQEQKDIQQHLLDRDEYVQRMLAQAPVQFAVIKGEDWVGDFATPQFKLLVGGRDIVGKPFKEALPELKDQGFFEILEDVYTNGKLHRGYEQPAYLDRKGNGELELGYFDFIYQPLFNADTTVEGVMILIVEVTEQVIAKQQAESLTAELKASHDRLTQVMDAMPHMTFTTQPDGYVTYYSQQWYEFLGGTRDTLSYWGWEDFIHPDDIEKTLSGWKKSLRTGEKFTIENRWRPNENVDYRWFLMRCVPVRGSNGEIIMWVGSQTDIQEQKEAQMALQESTEQFQFLAESMPQLVWTSDPNGFHDYFNKKWVEFTGYDLEASKGTQMWKNLLHPDDQTRAANRWQESLMTGKPYQIEYRFKRASDGEWRWFLARALPILDQEGNIVRWFGTCTDIEEQKRNEELLAETNKELHTINEDLDSFVYTASHDLKLPIINMAGIFHELIKNVTFHDSDAELLIGMFDKSLQQINATISDLSEIVKVQKNINANREKVQLTELVEEVKLSIQDMIQASDAKINVDFTQVPTLTFSRVNLKSIFYNLISNSVKYRSEARTPVVNISTHKEGDYVILTVQDNGMGMNMERHGPKMFQMFKRFHNHVAGSGLGLYIINRILQKNGGHITVQSQEGHGTTFTVYFKESY